MKRREASSPLDDEMFYDSKATEINGDPSQSLEEVADWSPLFASGPEFKVTKTISQTSSSTETQTENPRPLTPMPPRRLLSPRYPSTRAHQQPCIMEQEFEVWISDDESQSVVEDEETEESENLSRGKHEEGDEIDKEDLWGPPLLPPGATTDPMSNGGAVPPRHKTNVDDEATRIRNAVSKHNLGQYRPPTPYPTQPKRDSKRMVSSESTSLMECQHPNDTFVVNRVDANRVHKFREPIEQSKTSLFKEVEDSRINAAALCNEHMSLRGMTMPSHRPSPFMGQSAAERGSIIATTGAYTDRKYNDQSVSQRQGPNPPSSSEIRRHIMYAPQLKTGVPRDFLVYFLVSMATLASIFVAIGAFSKHKRVEHLDEISLQNAPGPSFGINFSAPLVLFNCRPTRNNNFGVCKGLECKREGINLASTLDWALDPCSDFHAFVCRRPRATALQEMEQHVALRLRRRPLSVFLVPLQRLRHECLEAKGRSWNQLRDLFDRLDLKGWPFSDSRNVSRDRVWEVAANLKRQLGITSLLAVSRQPGSKLLVLNIASAWLRGEDDLMASRYRTIAGALRSESDMDASLETAQLVQLARDLTDLPSESPVERAWVDDSPYKLFLSSLLKINNSEPQGKPDVLFSRQQALRLTKLLDQVEPHVILNYQGFLATLSVEPLLPGANASEPQCGRLVEDALPELFLYAAFLSQRSVMAAVSNMTEDVKRNLILYVNSASWMEAGVRRELVERLRELRVKAFVPWWFWETDRVHVQFGKLPQVGPGITALAALMEHAQNRLLRGNAWPTAPTDSRCAYDSSHRILYLPLLAANLSGPLVESLTLGRLPRMGTELTACLLHVVTSGAGRWWGERTVRNLEPLRKCVVSQTSEGVASDHLLERLAALAPVHNLYNEWLRARGAGDKKHGNVTSKELFFIYYVMSQCHASPEQVNVPLQNYEPFRKAFGCRTGTLMAPANTCRFWAA